MDDKTEKTSPLRVSRVARGLSQPELAVRAGIGLTTLRRLEAGDPITKDVAAKIARALDATADERLGWRQHALEYREERLVNEIASAPGLAELLAEFHRVLTETAAAQPEATNPPGQPDERVGAEVAVTAAHVEPTSTDPGATTDTVAAPNPATDAKE